MAGIKLIDTKVVTYMYPITVATKVCSPSSGGSSAAHSCAKPSTFTFGADSSDSKGIMFLAEPKVKNH